MKKKFNLFLLLFAVVSIFVLNFGQVTKNLTTCGSPMDERDGPIDVNGVYEKWTVL